MYKTKKEVDAHVRSALSKARSETERQLRSFTIAKLYYKINEFASAEQYLSSYLTVKEDNDQAHKLLGQCFQRLKKPDKALQSYQRSLQLNPKQPDVLTEVCQLLLEDKNLNANKAKYWCDLAESEKVQHDAVFSLRLKLMNKDNLETNQVEDMIQKEISARPNDVQLRVRLMRNYIEQNKILDAFKYIYNLEMSLNDHFTSSSEWYNIVWLVLSKYELMPNTKKDWEFWLLLVICLERQVYISFSLAVGSATGGVTETANLLFNLDQYLFKITQLSDKLCVQRELVSLFLDHYRGQVLLHAVSLIFKRELLQNKNKWKETVKVVLPLLLLAFQIEAPDNKEPWMKHCDEQGKQLIQLWNREGSFRCAQAGRTLLTCIADETSDKENATLQINNMLGNQPQLWSNCDELLAQIRQTCSDRQWRRNVFALLFCNSDQKVKEQSSMLIKSPKLAEPEFELPTYADVERYEEAAQYLKPQSLQHMVYLCLGNDNLSYVRAKYFSGLNFSTHNLAFCGAESLNQLDVDTFLYAATIQAKRMLQVEREAFDNYNSGNRSAAGKPRILPFVNLHGQLCTEEQANWWLAAYQVYKNLSSDNLAELRANLQFGIEAVRGINGPKIDMVIVFKLGQIFVARAQDIVKPVEKAFLESRAESVYKYGLNMVKMNNKGVLEPFRKYFKYAKANTSAVERVVASAAEDAVSYLATRYFKKAEYEDLIEELAGIQLPFATYLQAEAYRKLDEANKTPKKAKRMYLDRASECLNQTLMLLKNTETDPNHPLNSIIHTELKRLQQASMKFANDTYGSPIGGHNNSSTYEDAEADFYPDMGPTNASMNRSRREAAAAALIVSPRNTEMENLVKQMATTLSFVKEELVDTIKPEMLSMRKEITSLKDKIANLEEAVKRTRIASNPPSRDDASHVLDDLYMIEDALQNQLYQPAQQSHLPPANSMFPAVTNGPTVSPFAHTQQQQQRNTMQMQQNAMAAAAYNNPIFNPNYYYTQQYMMSSQAGAPGAGALLGQRNALPLPYMDTGAGMNFTMPQSAPLLPAPTQDGRPSNLYGLLTQPQQQSGAPPPLPQLSAPMSMPQLVPPATSIAPVAVPPMGGSIPPPMAQPSTPAVPAQFNKALNNQPVEKGPPANVVITTSDPLPNPNSATLHSQQPTLSVTIPSHHIKPSLMQTPDTAPQPQPTPASVAPVVTSTAITANGGSFAGFGLGGSAISTSMASPFAGFGCSLATPTSSATSIFSGSSSGNKPAVVPATSISSTTFSFKPQIEQAQSLAAAANASESAQNKTSDSVSSDFNRSGTEPEVEYDPRPDFKPIIPLPDEIEVKTGEEDEEIMFCCRAKLFRFADKDWKERGIGDIKILKNKDGYSRILMRRYQTHKICANHKITKELILTAPKNDRGHIWIANDFADEELKVERFFVRFKLPESAQQFFDAFKKAQKEAGELDAKKSSSAVLTPTVKMAEPKENKDADRKPALLQPFGLAKSAVANFATSTPASKSSASVGGTLATVAPIHVIAPIATTASSSGAPALAINTTSTSKALFGGFSLSTNNVVDTPPTNKAADSAKPTASPFANFSFDKAGNAAVTSTPAPNAPPPSSASPFANIFSNLGKTTTASQSPFSPINLPAFQSPFGISSTAGATTNAEVATAPPPTSAAADSTSSALNKSNVSETEDEYVPTATFNPVIPLPDLVEVATGEENEIVLFEHRAKLLRFDKEAGEWKERGLGNFKLLQDKDDVNKVRLLMRREQVHKLCCNQRLYKDTTFKYAKNSQTALTWAGQDYSENELITEMLTVRFKTPETCQQFHEAVLKAQANMSAAAEEGNVKAQAAEDKQRQKDQDAAKEKETEKTGKETPKGFGDAFKPKAGSWSCSACYISNAADKLYCIACDSPKDDTVPKKEATSSLLMNAPKSTFSFGFAAAGAVGSTANTTTAKSTFTFGMPSSVSVAATTTTTTNTKPSAAEAAITAPKPSGTGFGDQFKPKEGSWSCQACYLNNTADANYCKACDAPKDDTVPKKEDTSSVLSLSNPSQKFTFGFAAAGVNGSDAPKPVTPAQPSFTFGTPTATQSDPGKPIFGGLAANSNATDGTKSFSFAPPTANSTATSLTKPTFSFSLQSKAMDAPAMPGANAAGGGGGEAVAAPFSLDKKDFNFTLKPKSPGKVGKSPLKFGGGGGDADGAGEEGDDGDYHEEEENNTYFTPAIPLPDKIDVKTGEENEELLYVHRAKLYRFSDGEWKERGVGDVKILRHKETQKLRVVMRRDQVLKICLNHALNEDVEYKYKDDKSWLFVVNDFSEGSMELEKFSLRFKSKEIALSFMDAVSEALAGTSVPIENAGGNASIGHALLVTPTKAPQTPESELSELEKKTADKLQLPYEFFTAKPACPGCRGCDPDTFVFPTPKLDEVYVDQQESKHPLGPMELPELTTPRPSLSTPSATNTATTQSTAAVGTPVGSMTPTTAPSSGNRSLLKQSALSPAVASATSSTPTTAGNAAKPSEATNIFSGFGGANSTAFGSVGTGEKTASAFSFTAALNSSNKADETKTGGNGGFVFGNSGGGVSGSSLFGGGAGDKNPIFGQTPSIFGNASAALKTGDANASVDKPQSIFGGNATSASSGSIFGGKPIFGGGSSIFDGKANASANDTGKSIFGGVANVSQSNNGNSNGASTGSSIFGSSFAGFGNSVNTQTSIFGGASTNTSISPFANIVKEQPVASVPAPSFADLSSKAGAVDFASLAANASVGSTAKQPGEKPRGGFIGLTDQDAFSSFRKASNNSNSLNASKSKDDAGNDSTQNAEDDENYDPHYEPIIALPNEIVVSTGEEEETKLFGERATLYRWDANTKEWKERGVGELKILLHPTHQTYRMLMRREQIHKLVLNHAVGADFSFTNMNNNPKSFLWATLNYAESSEGELEKLAVRFKNADLAKQFSKKLNECIETAKQRLAKQQD